MFNILIQEDNFKLAAQWENAFVKKKYSVTVVENTTEAKLAVENFKYDLVIVDLIYQIDGQYEPDGGLLLISHLRNHLAGSNRKWFSKVPIIAVSGEMKLWKGELSPLRMAKKMGASMTMDKPFVLEELLNAADFLLNESKKE